MAAPSYAIYIYVCVCVCVCMYVCVCVYGLDDLGMESL
jgi:hypothetical protein